MSSSYSSVGLQALTGSLVGLTVLSLAFRLHCRRKNRMRLWADDYLIFIAWVTFIGIAALMFEFVHIGALGQLKISHKAQIAALTTPYAAKLQVSLGFLNIFCLGCTKLSACFLYYRIFHVRGTKASLYIKIVVASIVLLAIWIVAFLILFGLSCEGHWYGLWNVKYHDKYCSNLWTYLYAVSVSDVVLDLWVLALPLYPVLRLHATPKTQLSMGAVFLLGAVALGASIARLVIWAELFAVGWSHFTDDGAQYFQSRTFFFFTLECGIAIVAINLPIIGSAAMRTDPQSLVKAARSVISLVSRSSSDRGSAKAKQNNPQPDDPTHNDSIGSNEAYAMHDLHALKGKAFDSKHSPGDIYVEDTVDVSSMRREADGSKQMEN